MPPSRGFVVMPGNFDCPEATDSTLPLTRQPSTHRRYTPYHDREENSSPAVASGTGPMERNESPERTAAQLRRRIGDLRRVQALENQGERRTASEVAAAASARARWARSTIARSARSRLHQHRLRRRNEDDSIGTVQEAVNRLDEANSDLSSILDEPLPQILSSDDFMGLVPDTEVLERRHKRRKLDSDALDAEPPPKYGYYGQVVPGRLKMSILGCDGGYLTERDENCLHRHYCPENVLRNDKSVYCTERDQCNIILKHWKETPFSLSKVVIKTPDMGFTAPVQEGLIFVSMTAEHLLSRTSQYQISRPASHPPPESDSPYSRGGGYPYGTDFISRYANLRTFVHPNTDDDARPPSRRRYHATNPATASASYPADFEPESWPSWFDDGENWDDLNSPHDLGEIGPSRQQNPTVQTTPSQFQVTATCDDPSDDEEEVTSEAILRDRQRRRHLGLEWPSTDEDTDSSMRRHRRRRSHPREIKPVTRPRDIDELSRDTIVPHARFFIERRRSIVSIKFDPPVSGRYVLVKMWSPENRDNIDIQSISIYGFAGQRFVPAIQLR